MLVTNPLVRKRDKINDWHRQCVLTHCVCFHVFPACKIDEAITASHRNLDADTHHTPPNGQVRHHRWALSNRIKGVARQRPLISYWKKSLFQCKHIHPSAVMRCLLEVTMMRGRSEALGSFWRAGCVRLLCLHTTTNMDIPSVAKKIWISVKKTK